MRKLTASATLCVGLTLLATQAEAQHKTHSGGVHTQAELQHKTRSEVAHTQAELQHKTRSEVAHTQAELQHKTRSEVAHTQAELHKIHSGVVHTQREYVRLAEVCAFEFWCDTDTELTAVDAACQLSLGGDERPRWGRVVAVQDTHAAPETKGADFG